jgi:flavin reductase (DIM6/NTAB) family NADH-FMN oxidoreductase RutF
MEKIVISKCRGAKTFLYPQPVVLVGANVKGKPNYLVVTYCGIIQHVPSMIVVALDRTHYTNIGVKENGTFSVNIPSADMVKSADYCGLYSGKRFDKSSIYETFYGKLGTAPMIKKCPINLECKRIQHLDFGGIDEIFIGEIIEAYTEKKFLTNGLLDIKKIKPILFTIQDNGYWQVGDYLAKAYSVGKDYKTKK